MGKKAQAWMERAMTARRIAQTLGGSDAQILESFAEECGARAACLAGEPPGERCCMLCPLALAGGC